MSNWGVIGCGWLGLPFAEKLASQGHNVIGTTSSVDKAPLLASKNIQSKILRQPDFFEEWDAFNELDYVLLNIPPSQFKETYAEAMGNIVRQLNDRCRVVFISSTSVYPNNEQRVDENTPATGTGRNGSYVAAAEKKIQSLKPEDVTILRLAGLVGGDRHPAKYMQGKSIGGAATPVNLVHREDCLSAIRAVQQHNCWGKTINICASQHPKKKTYYTDVAEKMNLDKIAFNDSQRPFKIVDNQRSKSLLGMKYKYDSPFDFPI